MLEESLPAKPVQPSAILQALYEAREKRRIQEDAERLSAPGSLLNFVREAWTVLKPHEPFISNWHLEAIAAHLEAVSSGQIHRLQIWIPPGTMKTGMVSVYWHSWEWTTRPWLRYWTASYETRLIQRFSIQAQQVITSRWYRERWGDMFSLRSEAAHYWANDQGGTRLATSPQSTGTGEHGHRILVDDPIPARAGEVDAGVQKDLKTLVQEANDWWDATASTRYIDNAELGFSHARVLVMQRLHEGDLAAHMLDQEDWTVLCLPERFEKGHDYAWRGENIHKGVALPDHLKNGDPREEDELLWPSRRDETASNVLARQLGTHRAAGQLQQRPAAREGEIIKRHWWNFYDPRIRSQDDWKRLGQLGMVVVSVDTPLKDKETNDNVAVQCWGIKGADNYLLDLKLGKMGYASAKRTIREMATWARGIWRGVPHYLLIENAGYGPELIVDLKRELSGVVKVPPGADGNKETRAISATDALESGNYFLPGIGPPTHPVFDEAKSPADVVAFVANLARFPNGMHDDDVDAWSQFGNWRRSKNVTPLRTSSPHRSRMPVR